MATEYSLDQRLYRLGLTKKDIYEQCKARGIKISYQKVQETIEYPNEVDYKYKEKVRKVITELESQKGITDIYFDER